ncbi:acetyl-CoA acetyltransferase [Pseudomonas sp. LFM046]|uniref:thiolase C-terminal domain-containing protein n=1 Tax=Pseudomonas sp. LFM046 TaxID=1608357 RepID=UPI0005CFC605|nr:acetyl-CoA acetyltransferase [Pseudomonas sp. LFM046]
MADSVLVAGVGMTPFVPLGTCDSTAALAGRAIRAALEDARIDYDLVDQVFTSCVQCEAGSGERVLAHVGLTGVPIFNVSDGCASGSSALQLARHAVLCGEAECVLVLGYECMPAGVTNRAFFGMDEYPSVEWDSLHHRSDPLASLHRRQHPAALFASQTNWLLTRMGIAESSFEQVLGHARGQARINPYAVLNRSSCFDGWLAPYLCPPACGAAAVLLCSRSFVARYGARRDVALLSCARSSDTTSELESASVLDVLGRAATRRVAQKAYEQAGIGPDEIEVVELHDQSVGDFMINSAALGFCREEELDQFLLQNFSTRGRQVAVCPSGGLLGRGHAPGATGLAQITELVWQLRGQAEGRQIAGARTALQHSSALGRSVSVTVLQRTLG